MAPVRAEYAGLLDDHRWLGRRMARSSRSLPDLDFFGKLKHCYSRGLDWFQPLDISLPGDQIHDDTPMHFGPAVFSLITAPRLLDIVESLIGPEITSNPIQHVRLKPPATALRGDEISAHITRTDWHQDRGVAHDEADMTDMVTVWIAMNDATEENGCLKVVPQGGGDRPVAALHENPDHHRRRLHRCREGRVTAGTRRRHRPAAPADTALLAGETSTAVSAGLSISVSTALASRRGGRTSRALSPEAAMRRRNELRDWRRWKAKRAPRLSAHSAHPDPSMDVGCALLRMTINPDVSAVKIRCHVPDNPPRS